MVIAAPHQLIILGCHQYARQDEKLTLNAGNRLRAGRFGFGCARATRREHWPGGRRGRNVGDLLRAGGGVTLSDSSSGSLEM